MNTMRIRLCSLALLPCLAVAVASAQTPAAPAVPVAVPGTGDGWMDAQLADLNHYARRYPAAFADELVRYHNAPRRLITELLAQHWAPADVYYACALAAATGQACRAVAQERGAHRDENWRLVAARLGVTVDAGLQRRLHEQVVASYGRWGRPVLPEAPAPDASAPATHATPEAGRNVVPAVPHRNRPVMPRARRLPPAGSGGP